MSISVFSDGIKLPEIKFHTEEEFELELKNNYKALFGNKTLYLDIKRKIDTTYLGGSIPDGILFDFEDPEDVKFYLVEAELSAHDFYKHIFPQITKFFAFFKNYSARNGLIEKLFAFINETPEILEEFKKLSHNSEIYKSIKDAVENNQNILIVIDEEKPEFKEIMDTYTDTWDKFVIIEVLKKYKLGSKEVFSMYPDFSEKELFLEEEEISKPIEDKKYTEVYHLEGTSDLVQSMYKRIKEYAITQNKDLIFNPQKYYISIRDRRNFVYLDIKKKKIKIAVMLPYSRGKDIIQNNRLRKFTEGIERFYGGPSFEVTLENENYIDEVFFVLKEAYERQKI